MFIFRDNGLAAAGRCAAACPCAAILTITTNGNVNYAFPCFFIVGLFSTVPYGTVAFLKESDAKNF